ncbi:MAG: HAMP domain-containing sensor histidine kinase [Ghiorsea sp.]|nr:HAMP domain-containing sensor histidine kinase [Ghiorsea sp.]
MLLNISEITVKRESNMRKTMHVFSHDLRNPLLNIQALVQEATTLIQDATQAERTGSKESLSDILGKELPEVLELLNYSANRMDDMVLGANEIYHCLFDELECELVDMHTVFMRCFAQLKLADDNLEIDCVGLPAVYADMLAVKRVVWELLCNAKKAINAREEPYSRVITVNASHEEGMIVFTVEDCGCGLSEHEEKSVFESFFTGKYFKGNSGMGLTRAQALIERHGGRMRITNRDGGGAIVSFSLPKSSPSLIS